MRRLARRELSGRLRSIHCGSMLGEVAGLGGLAVVLSVPVWLAWYWFVRREVIPVDAGPAAHIGTAI